MKERKIWPLAFYLARGTSGEWGERGFSSLSPSLSLSLSLSMLLFLSLSMLLFLSLSMLLFLSLSMLLFLSLSYFQSPSF